MIAIYLGLGLLGYLVISVITAFFTGRFFYKGMSGTVRG